MLGELSAIIDDLYRNVSAGIVNKKKLVFLLGAGFLPVNNILNDSRLLAKYNSDLKPGSPIEIDSKVFQDYKWRHFEAARAYSSNTCPSFAHYCIYTMIKDGICRDVITTNYDLFLDSLLEKYPDVPILKNPVGRPGEYLWDGYYSHPIEPEDMPRYWKIHGSLSHIVFRGTDPSSAPMLFRLPRFPISGNHPEIVDAFPKLNPIPCMNFEAYRYPGTKFSDCGSLEKRFEPFIDWTLGEKRDPFQREIVAVKTLLRDSERIAAILLVGFTGRFNPTPGRTARKEEVVEPLLEILHGAEAPIFMGVTRDQWARGETDPTQYALMQELKRVKRCFSFTEAADYFTEFLSPPASKWFKYQPVRNEYEDHTRLYRKEPEPIHGRCT